MSNTNKRSGRGKPGVGNVYRFLAGCAALALATQYAGAQTRVDLKTQSKSVDFSAASSSKPFQSGATLSGTCSQGQTFFKTNAAPGANFYACTSPDTWTLESGNGSGDVSTTAAATFGAHSYDFTAATVSLPNVHLRSDTGWTMTAGQKGVGTPSATTAAWRTVCGSIPSALAAGDFMCNPAGVFGGYDGTNANAFVTFAGSGVAYGTTPTSGHHVLWSSSYGLSTTGSAIWSVANGGTGLATLMPHAVYVGNGTTAPTALSVGTTNTVLHGNTGADPSFSAIATGDIAANAVTSAKMAMANTHRTCTMIVGADNGAALTNATLGPQGRQCFVPFAATVVEVTVAADGGTPNVIPRKNHAGSGSNLVSSALATASSGGLACSNTGGTTGLDGATTCTNTLQNTSLATGDWIELISGTAGGVAKRMSISVTYTVN